MAEVLHSVASSLRLTPRRGRSGRSRPLPRAPGERPGALFLAVRRQDEQHVRLTARTAEDPVGGDGPPRRDSRDPRVATTGRQARAGIPGRRTGGGPRHAVALRQQLGEPAAAQGYIQPDVVQARRQRAEAACRRSGPKTAVITNFRARLHRLSQGRDPVRDIGQPPLAPATSPIVRAATAIEGSGRPGSTFPGSRRRRGTANRVRAARPPSTSWRKLALARAVPARDGCPNRSRITAPRGQRCRARSGRPK